MLIREASRADAPALAALINRAYRVEDFFKTGDRIDADGVEHEMAEGGFLVLEDWESAERRGATIHGR